MKYAINNCIDVAHNRHGKCISVVYINCGTKMTWECALGHRWKATFANIVAGTWCYSCRGKRISERLRLKNGLKLAQEFAKNKGGKCLSTEYINTKTKMSWVCANDHRWAAQLDSIKNKQSWCNKCAADKLKFKDALKVASRYAKNKKGKCLSKKYAGSKKNLRWQCLDKHEWDARLQSIINGTWCPYCIGVKVDADERLREAKDIATNRNGLCLSDKYIRYTSKMKWKCDKNHEWAATFYKIKIGRWCPRCKLKNQTNIYKIIQELFVDFAVKQNCRSLDFLKNKSTGRNLELDIWVPHIKLAIEYDGEQHFHPVRFNNISEEKAKKKFKRVLALDNLKNKLVAQAIGNGKVNNFIRFNYKEAIDKDYVMQILQNNGALLHG